MDLLNQDQLEFFMKNGFIVIKKCFDKEVAEDWVSNGFSRLGYDPADPNTWKEEYIRIRSSIEVDLPTFSPKLWNCICQILGGENRIKRPKVWDSFIFNLSLGHTTSWQYPSPQIKGWHIDGNSFKHFLDSPEQGLLSIFIWTDIVHKGGGTFIACDSIPIVAEYLLNHPEGKLFNEINFWELIRKCNTFYEITADAGDVILIHPLVLHTSSQNHSCRPRVITNPPIELLEPFCFNRENPNDYSFVELTTLKALNVEKLDFKIRGIRERLS